MFRERITAGLPSINVEIADNQAGTCSGIVEKYKLGEYEFDTYEELLAAEEDTKKIDVITSSMDVTDLEVALSLYEKIRNNEIIFHSSVGSGFLMYLSDIVSK